MITVILVIHLMIAAGLVGVVLMQKSEGGALGIGGGGGAGGLLSGRGTANLLSRTTAALAAAFFVTSLLLTILAQHATAPRSVFEQPGTTTDGKAPAGRGGLLDRLQGGQPAAPAPTPAPTTPAPAGTAPATPAPTAPSGPAVPQTR